MGESTQATGDDRTTEVIRAATVQDVTVAVVRAAADGVPLVVVGGGHSVWARTDVGGLRLELADLADVRVDGTIVRVGGGATWGQVAAELAGHGLAISSGDTSSVGVGGLTTGGGRGRRDLCAARTGAVLGAARRRRQLRRRHSLRFPGPSAAWHRLR